MDADGLMLVCHDELMLGCMKLVDVVDVEEIGELGVL